MLYTCNHCNPKCINNMGNMPRRRKVYPSEGVTCLWVTSIICLLVCQVSGSGFRQRIPKRGPRPVSPVILKNTPTNYTAHVGETAILKCAVVNLGTKTVIWRKSDVSTPLTVGVLTYYGDPRFQMHHVVHKDQWNLHIRNVSMKDEGAYECQVSTKERNIRRNYHLKIKEPKSGIHISGNTYVEKNQRLTLKCNATNASGDWPPDDLDWFMNGHKVVTDPSRGIYITKTVSLRNRTIQSELTIMRTLMKHGGTYVCRTSEKLVTNTKVNILNAGTYNVKRGTLTSKDLVSDIEENNPSGSYRNCVSAVTLVIVMFCAHVWTNCR